MRARWAIILANLTVIWREVNLRKKPKELLATSSKATVPLLITQEGVILEESMDIIKWALEKFDKDLILDSGTTTSKLDIDLLINENDNIFKYHLDKYKYSSRLDVDNFNYHKNIARNILVKWNRMILNSIKKNNTYWLVGGKQTIADLALWPFVRQYRGVDSTSFDNDDELQELNLWLKFYTDNTLFKTLMHKTKEWEVNSLPIYFPPIISK